MRRLGRVAVVSVLMAAAAAAVAGGSPQRPTHREVPPEVACKFDAVRGTMAVRMRAGYAEVGFPPGLPKELRPDRQDLLEKIPPAATIERRRETIALLPGGELFETLMDDPPRGPAACSGGDARVDNTERVTVRGGRHTDAALFSLDLTYGDFEPGRSDEGDGSSEIEFDVRIRGDMAVLGSRDPDRLVVAQQEGAVAVNLDSAEPVADPDILFAEDAFVFLDGAGGADTIDSTGVAFGPTDSGILGKFAVGGGQGVDTLVAGAGSDILFPGPGRDVVDAGAGPDILFVTGGTPDRADCGRGEDLVIAVTRLAKDRFYDNCELIEDELGFGPADRQARRALRVKRALRD